LILEAAQDVLSAKGQCSTEDMMMKTYGIYGKMMKRRYLNTILGTTLGTYRNMMKA